MRPAERLWVLGGAVVLVAASAFTIARSTEDEPAPPARKPPAGVPHRSLTGERFGGNLPGAPEVVRVARDGTVWTIVRDGSHTSLARLEGRLLRGVPLGGAEPLSIVEGYRRQSPYLAYSTRSTIGTVLPDGTSTGKIAVGGDVRDLALDRFGAIWFTDAASASLGAWDGRRLDHVRVTDKPRPQLDDIVLAGAGSAKLWFLDLRGRVGLADPAARGVVRRFRAPGGRPSPGPSRLTGSFARAAWYTTGWGVGKVTEEGGSKLVVRRLPAPPGPLAGGSDGNLWVAARRGPRLFRISPSGSVAEYRLDVPRNARFRDIARDTRRGCLWIAAARPRALLRVAIPELRSKMH